jgi:tetratricopeptide (TPR) repeat protein
LKQSSRRFRNVLLILVAAVVIAGGTIYLVYATVTARRSTALRIDDLLVEADYEISLGYYDKALETLDAALDQARGAFNSLRILKRVYQISYNLNDFSILHRFARSAADSIPGSQELKEIYLYASIRASAEDSQRAVELLKRSRGDSAGNLAYLRAEAYLAGFLDTPPETNSDPELTRIMSLVTQPSLDPYQLQRLGTDLDEPRIHLDAALLWMAEGDAESAFTVVNRHIEDPAFREPSIYISYDAGHEQTALSVVQELREQGRIADRVDLQVMEADLRLILGDGGEATRLYRQIITSHPAYSWTPYLNLALIYEQNADRQTAYALRERAHAQFPTVGAVVMSHARSLTEIGDRERAAAILQSYLAEHGEDYQAQLALLDVQNTASSPVLYQAALWKLYNRHPESRMLCEHLFLYLLEFNDLSGAESALRHYQLATGRTQEPWFLDYRAVLAALHQDDAEAVRLLQERLAREDSWQARFNLAVLLGRANRPDQAIEQLIEAEHLLPEEQNRTFRSRIRSRIGEQYLLLGDVEAARRECEYAIDLDVSNFHAHRILRILERE